MDALSAGSRDRTSIDVWSLADGSDPSPAASPAVAMFGAGGSRAALAWRALSARGIDRRTLVLLQHVHLSPVALPLMARGARVLVLFHGIEAWTPLRALERMACRRAWKLAAVSACTVRRFRDANSSLEHLPVSVCAPGLQAAPAPDPAPVGGPPYALIVGRMTASERYKGHDALLEVWPRIAAAVPGARLLVAGGGDDAARLAAKAARLGVSGLVTFEGVVSAARLAALYRDAALFVMPSPNEGFGLVYAEAMRAGVPCVAVPGAAEEIIEHGRTGLIVPAGDSAALAAAIVRLFAEPDERRRMGAAARVSAARFTADAFRTRFRALADLPPLRAPVLRESTVAC
jgi:phosphatidylinositol alpha-1,6-mannosyltransferase